MRAVNLARRPFVNRQPVLRLAGLLWLIGVVFLFINVRLYSSYWQGSAGYRQQLTEVGQEVQEAQQLLNEHNPELSRVNLSQENSRTKFLNSLISYRTFPWSALFDDLEDVVPIDVRLTSVKPAVRLVAEAPEPQRRRSRTNTPRRSTSRRGIPQATTASQTDGVAADDDGGSGEEVARSTSSSRSTSSRRSGGRASSENLRSNEVMLDVAGVARTQEALMEFIDILYSSPSFRQPFLPGETINEQDGSTKFSINVIYLTRPPELPEAAATLSEDGDPEDAELDGTDLDDDDLADAELEGDGSQVAAAPTTDDGDSGQIAGTEDSGVELPAASLATGVAATNPAESTRSTVAEKPAASQSENPEQSVIDRREDARRSAVARRAQAASEETATAGRSNTGRSNTGRSNTGRSNTGRSNTGRRAVGQGGTLPPGSVPGGGFPAGSGTTAPAGSVPTTGQAPAGRLPGAPAPPGGANPPASATPRLQSGSLLSSEVIWEAIA